jgi:hypothetical protein
VTPHTGMRDELSPHAQCREGLVELSQVVEIPVHLIDDEPSLILLLMASSMDHLMLLVRPIYTRDSMASIPFDSIDRRVEVPTSVATSSRTISFLVASDMIVSMAGHVKDSVFPVHTMKLSFYGSVQGSMISFNLRNRGIKGGAGKTIRDTTN